MNLQFSKISQAIAAVFWFWRHDPKSHMLIENQPKRCDMCGYVGKEDPVRGCPRCGWDEMQPATPEEIYAGTSCDDPVSPASLRASMDEAIAGTSAALRDGSLDAEQDAEAVRLKIKAKRIRPPRGKPLEPSDIVAGGEYVPKRGNNRTPNIIVERTTLDHDTSVRTVRWRQRDEVHVCTDTEFVKSYAARRVYHE